MKKLILALAILSTTAPAFALMGFLQSESVNYAQNVKYCRYSNGVILTVSPISLCPLSIN